MGVLDVARPPIASPFISDATVGAALFTTLADATITVGTDRRGLLLGDSTFNQFEEAFAQGCLAAAPTWPTWRVPYRAFNSVSQTLDAIPTILQAGDVVGTPVPVNGVVASDNFNRTDSELIGDVDQLGNQWSGSLAYYATNGTKAFQVGNLVGVSFALLAVPAKGDTTGTVKMGVANNEGVSKIHRLAWKYLNGTNYLQLNMTGSTTKAITLNKIIAGVSTTLATFAAGAIPNNAAQAEYNVSFSCIGLNVSATVNGVTASGTITSDDATLLSNAVSVGWGTNSTTATLDDLSVSVNGTRTDGPYKTLRVDNAAVAGTTLDYQTNDPVRLATILDGKDVDLLFIGHGHNYDADTPAAYFTKLDTGIAQVVAALGHPVPVVMISQNPEFSPALFPAQHNTRQRALRQYAADRGYGLIPTFEVFMSRLDQGQQLVNPDGIHPNFIGTPATGNGAQIQADIFAQWMRDHA